MYFTAGADDAKHSDELPYAGDGSAIGFDSRTDTFTLGADRRLNDTLVIGGALGMDSGHVAFTGSDSDQRSHGVDATIYASGSFLPEAYLSIAASYERTHFDVRRDSGSGGMSTFSPHGDSLGFSLASGYGFMRGAFTLSPYLRLDSVPAHVGAFSQADGPAAMSVDRQTMRSVTDNLGMQLQYALPVSWGVVLPQIRVELSRENSPSQTIPGGRLLSDKRTLLVPTSVAPDRHYGTWGFGLSSLGQHGLSMFADFEANFAQQDYRTRHFSIGLRTEI